VGFGGAMMEAYEFNQLLILPFGCPFASLEGFGSG